MSALPAVASLAARILIVDDDSDNREVLAIILGYEGFVAVHARSGEEALVVLAQRPLDLILLDVILPGMSGYETAAAVKRNPDTKGIPIIMMTAMNDAASRQRALRSGADDFLSKPFNRAELCLHVKALLLAPVAA